MTDREYLGQALMLEDSYSRLPRLLEHTFDLPADDWLHLLGEWWENCDNIGQYLEEIRESVTYHWSLTPIWQMMNAKENAAFDALPDVLIIYRGCYDINKWGASWSLNREVAERFPHLTRYSNEGRPLLIKATIPKSRVAALKLGRGEQEVVTFLRPKFISISTAILRESLALA